MNLASESASSDQFSFKNLFKEFNDIYKNRPEDFERFHREIWSDAGKRDSHRIQHNHQPILTLTLFVLASVTVYLICVAFPLNLFSGRRKISTLSKRRLAETSACGAGNGGFDQDGNGGERDNGGGDKEGGDDLGKDDTDGDDDDGGGEGQQKRWKRKGDQGTHEGGSQQGRPGAHMSDNLTDLDRVLDVNFFPVMSPNFGDTEEFGFVLLEDKEHVLHQQDQFMPQQQQQQVVQERQEEQAPGAEGYDKDDDEEGDIDNKSEKSGRGESSTDLENEDKKDCQKRRGASQIGKGRKTFGSSWRRKKSERTRSRVSLQQLELVETSTLSELEMLVEYIDAQEKTRAHRAAQYRTLKAVSDFLTRSEHAAKVKEEREAFSSRLTDLRKSRNPNLGPVPALGAFKNEVRKKMKEKLQALREAKLLEEPNQQGEGSQHEDQGPQEGGSRHEDQGLQERGSWHEDQGPKEGRSRYEDQGPKEGRSEEEEPNQKRAKVEELDDEDDLESLLIFPLHQWDSFEQEVQAQATHPLPIQPAQTQPVVLEDDDINLTAEDLSDIFQALEGDDNSA